MPELDSKDKKILQVLSENSRMSVRDIAKKTQLRPSTVHQRIQRLIENKVIEKFTLKLDNRAVGEDFIAFVYLSTKEDLPESFFHNPHIKEAFGITGEFDLILKLKFPNITAFNEYILQLRKNKSITKTITYIATINLKEILN